MVNYGFLKVESPAFPHPLTPAPGRGQRGIWGRRRRQSRLLLPQTPFLRKPCKCGASPWSFLAGRYILHQLEHAFVVRALPENLVARGADVEVVIEGPGQGLETVHDLFFGDGLQGVVAAQAAPERTDVLEQTKSAYDLADLQLGVEGADAIPVCQGAAHQQPPVAGQQDAVLIQGNLHQLVILVIVAVPRVEAQNPQVSSQLAKMVIQDEASFGAEGIVPWISAGPDIRRREGMNVDPVPILDFVSKIHRSAVHHDPGNFRVGHSQGFNQMLDRRALFENAAEAFVPPTGK